MRRANEYFRTGLLLVSATVLAVACGSDEAEPSGAPTGAEPAATSSSQSGPEEAESAEVEPAPTSPSETAEPAVEKVGVVFVGHGEPSSYADGDVAITFPDGRALGPFAASLGVPLAAQSTEWAAAYDEIATAMTYIFGDLNENEVLHEMMLSPVGDVPPFFTWEAFRAQLVEIYASFGDHSPHSELIAEHVAGLDLDVEGVEIDTYLAYLDAVPRIPDVMFEIGDDYDRLVVVPMLLASSTHTQEVAEQVEQSAQEGAEIIVVDPFYEVPFMRDRVAAAVVATADRLRGLLPADTSDSEVGVLLVAHGTPYVPPEPAFGWQEGEIFSHLTFIEDKFHDTLAAAFPFAVKTGRMNYAEPSIEVTLAEFEADGIKHVLVVPSAFPTAAMHTMWDVAEPTVGRAITPDEGIVVHTRDSGMTVYYSAEGYADFEQGRQEFRAGLEYLAESGVREVLGLAADESTT